MKKDFAKLINATQKEETRLRLDMLGLSKKLASLLEEKKELIKEDRLINQISIDAARRLTCMSKKTFCEWLLKMEASFMAQGDFINLGYEWFGYDIDAPTLSSDEEFINLLIISCGDSLIKKVFLSKQGRNKNIMKTFYYKATKKDLIKHIEDNYSDKFITKSNARSTIKNG